MANSLETRTKRTLSEGRYYPLGATLSPNGVNFALFSQNAAEVYLLLFDVADGEATDTIRLECRTKYIWHVFVAGLKAGQLYGFKVRGEFRPEYGFRFNENKLLLDPYAKAISGKIHNPDNLMLAYDTQSPHRDLTFDSRDNSQIAPKAIVVDDASFDWRGDARPDIPLERLFLYEVHAKGFTAHESSRVSKPGSYAGFVEKIPYLKDLGVNAVELLPVHEHYAEDFITEKGLANYWGYNTVGFFAPESSYAFHGSSAQLPGNQVDEFKFLVRELHKAGIEVILDVVYNHTGEGNELGPTISFRGIDNPSYYTLAGTPHHPYRYYMNHTGCGNTLNLANPPVIRLVMDSLRYWVETMHVDGFRFDLASVLGREESGFARSSGFFDAISQDPVLNRIKLIAEPWDIGTYQVGNFPVDWCEWNGKFRDTARRFLKGDPGLVRDLGWRLTGSADLYADDGRSAYNSINFITCHDGFTLHDLYAYDGKHNDANNEGNRDGSDDNNSWNGGWEGETDKPDILATRRRLAKNAMCLLLCASGTPMLLGGDEFLRTQNGNNNAYCQDNAISWYDWTRLEKNADMHRFVKNLIAVCRTYPILQKRKYFTSGDSNANNVPDLQWYGVGGGDVNWDDGNLKALGYALDGSEAGKDAASYRLYVFFNSDHVCQPFVLSVAGGRSLYRVIDTNLDGGADCVVEGTPLPLTKNVPFTYLVSPRSTVILVEK